MSSIANNKINKLNPVQKKSYALIQADARFLYTLTELRNNPKIEGNYIMMAPPFIGLFADGAEQWGKKVGIETPTFTDAERKHYEAMRNSIKFFDMGFDGFNEMLRTAFDKSDKHFYDTRTIGSRIRNLY